MLHHQRRGLDRDGCVIQHRTTPEYEELVAFVYRNC